MPVYQMQTYTTNPTTARAGSAARCASSPRNGQKSAVGAQFRIIKAGTVAEAGRRLLAGETAEQVTAWLCAQGAFAPSARMLCRLLPCA